MFSTDRELLTAWEMKSWYSARTGSPEESTAFDLSLSVHTNDPVELTSVTQLYTRLASTDWCHIVAIA